MIFLFFRCFSFLQRLYKPSSVIRTNEFCTNNQPRSCHCKTIHWRVTILHFAHHYRWYHYWHASDKEGTISKRYFDLHGLISRFVIFVELRKTISRIIYISIFFWHFLPFHREIEQEKIKRYFSPLDCNYFQKKKKISFHQMIIIFSIGYCWRFLFAIIYNYSWCR